MLNGGNANAAERPAATGSNQRPNQIVLAAEFIRGRIARPEATSGLQSGVYPFFPQQFLYFLPLPQGQGALRESFLWDMADPFHDIICLGFTHSEGHCSASALECQGRGEGKEEG